MIYTLEDFLCKFIGFKKIVIYSIDDDIEDKFEFDEIPKEWLNRRVIDFDFTFGTLFIVI